MGALRNLTDRAYRYRANNSIPQHPKVCVFCGATGALQVGHVDGHEEDSEAGNLSWVCRSCNQIAAQTINAAGLGRRTHQYNPSKSAGAKSLGQWLQAVGAITPKVDRGDRGLSSDMSVGDAVAMIRATPHHKRSSFAAELRSRIGKRKSNPKRNLFGFGSRKPAEEKYWVDGVGYLPTKAKAIAAAKQEAKDTGNRVKIEWGRGSTTTVLPPHKKAETSEAPTRSRRATAGSYKGYKIWSDDEGRYRTSLDPGSWFDSQRETRAFIDSWVKGRSNPASYRGQSVAKLEQMRVYAMARAYDDDWMVRSGGRRDVEAIDKALKAVRKREAKGNPSKFDRCVKEVKKKGGAANAYAVCTAAGTRNPSPAQLSSDPNKGYWAAGYTFKHQGAAMQYAKQQSKGGRQEFVLKRPGDGMVAGFDSGLKINPAKRNPSDTAVEGYKEFHGHEPDEVVTVKKKIHYHSKLFGLGSLKKLTFKGVDKQWHSLKGFKGAILASSERKNQIYIEGGDQSLNLADFGIDPVHEKEKLGKLVRVVYHTRKDHLGDEGGEGDYYHDFRTSVDENGQHITVPETRWPDLIYDVRNEQLEVVGGSYIIRAEGIDK